MDAAAWFNAVEAGLWIVIAVIVRVQWRGWALPIVLIAFGVSDVIEISSGAWYRPWWLLAWKVLCVAAISWLGWRLLRQRSVQQ